MHAICAWEINHVINGAGVFCWNVLEGGRVATEWGRGGAGCAGRRFNAEPEPHPSDAQHIHPNQEFSPYDASRLEQSCKLCTITGDPPWLGIPMHSELNETEIS
jgi:hypothetical protein